jgi:hypothetical protein
VEVTLEESAQAYLDAAQIQHRMGGIVSVMTYREPYGMEGEAITVCLAFQWQDRSNARPQREEFIEPQAETIPAPPPSTDPDSTPVDEPVPPPPLPEEPETLIGPEVVFDENGEPEEDQSSFVEAAAARA